MGKLLCNTSLKSSSNKDKISHKRSNIEFDGSSTINSDYGLIVNNNNNPNGKFSSVMRASGFYGLNPSYSNGDHEFMDSRKLGSRVIVKVGLDGGMNCDSLPKFSEPCGPEKLGVFITKLNLYGIVFDFNNPVKDLKKKDVKKQILIELVEFGTIVNVRFDEVVMGEIFKMVSENLFRTLPISCQDNNMSAVNVYDMEGDEPMVEPSWPHLQVMYEFLLRFLSSSEMDPMVANKYIDHSFILRLLELFDSEDKKEREYLKSILHRTYGKFMVQRNFEIVPVFRIMG